MRPARLELKGIAAFRDAQTIDFDGLDLFAISGPTGSGKTSILDAITYALYGHIDRVGRQAGQFVSQGQARMAVSFEFGVDDERFRVTRSTPAGRGQTKILLERREGDTWRQAGEGADRVRDADAMIREIVGLDYDAFSRTVLLPQGKFAEFLVGDAKDRRAILTELLGLELFERLARRAGELKRDAAIAAETKASLLETEYAGATPDALADAELAAKETASRDGALAAAEGTVRGAAEQWAESARSIRELEACARDVREAGRVAAVAERVLESLVERLGEADARAGEMANTAVEASREAKRAAKARAKAEGQWGRQRDVAALRARAAALVEKRALVVEVEAEWKEASRARLQLEKALRAAAKVLASRLADAEAEQLALEEAKTAFDQAQHAELVAAVRAGVHPGATCPVCGAHVESLPKGPRTRNLDRTRTALEQAKVRAWAVQTAHLEAQRAHDGAETALQASDREIARLQRESLKQAKELASLEEELTQSMDGRMPRDPTATLDQRMARLEELEEAERKAAGSAAEAKEGAIEAARARDAIVAEAAEERGRLNGLAISGLLDRARSVAGSDSTIPRMPSIAEARDAAALRAAAAEVAGGFGELAEGLEGAAAEHREAEGELLADAIAALDGLVAPRGSLMDLLDAVAEEHRRAAAEAATAEREAEQLRKKLENARSLAEEVAAARTRSERFGALTTELRADRIIAFLQLEALQMLAAAGSDHLSSLSSARYRLEYVEDEFFVVDTWNGEERRSARTLSGGETFLASLSLALALSEQVRSLSVTKKARLDSLFLDEGFGTLDPETLEVVVDAIERLGGDGRMVGVITHVQELAIRLPARIEIEKSPRGSSLRIVT